MAHPNPSAVADRFLDVRSASKSRAANTRTAARVRLDPRDPARSYLSELDAIEKALESVSETMDAVSGAHEDLTGKPDWDLYDAAVSLGEAHDHIAESRKRVKHFPTRSASVTRTAASFDVRVLMKAAHQIEDAYEKVYAELRGNRSVLAEELKQAVFPARDMPETMREIIQDMISAEVATKTASRTKTAGEVRFIKDRGSDDKEWGWGTPGPSEREIDSGFEFKPKYLKPLAQALRSALMALGHTTSAHARFVKIKSRNVSPDGNLGGKGYIQKVPDMRRQLMNCIEALSAFTDTVYDEVNAPHWNPDTLGGGNRERDEVEEIMEDVGEIKDDPEGWAEEVEEEMDEESDKGKKAGRAKTASRRTSVADRYLRRNQP